MRLQGYNADSEEMGAPYLAGVSTRQLIFPVRDVTNDSAAPAAASRELKISPVELAFADPAQLPPQLDIPPVELRRLQRNALADLSATPETGDDLLRHSLYPYHRYLGTVDKWSTTISELDDLLEGGFEAGEVVEVAGGRQSGRSALVLYTLLHHLLTHGDNRVIFLHTSAHFDASRCRSILHVLIDSGRAAGVTFDSERGDHLTTDELAIRVLNRLSVIRPLSPDQALEGISTELEATDGISMIVLDSAETLLGGEALSSSSAAGHAALVAFSRQIKQIARDRRLTVILVNSCTSSTSAPAHPITSLPLREYVKPSLGSSFTYLTDLTLWMSKAETVWGSDGRGKFVAEVARNRRGEARGWVCFDLTDGVTMTYVD